MSSKKAISEVVNFVLITLIVISLSALVFTYLKLYVPKDKPECNSEIHLIMSDYQCSKITNTITITFFNKGLFSIDAAYIRIGPKDRKVKQLINKEDLYFSTPASKNLKPGSPITKTYTSPEIKNTTLEIEIQPAIFSNNQLALCEQAVITQEITCN